MRENVLGDQKERRRKHSGWRQSFGLLELETVVKIILIQLFYIDSISNFIDTQVRRPYSTLHPSVMAAPSYRHNNNAPVSHRRSDAVGI
jgi:hypothetical protein